MTGLMFRLAQNGTVIEYNWSYNTMKNGVRFDRGTEEAAPWGYNGTMRLRCNVRASDEGRFHHLENNLSFESGVPCDLTLLGYPGNRTEGENTHTIMTGNIL